MPHDSAKLYENILRAIANVQSFCAGKTMADFEADRQCQLAVERGLEIINQSKH